MRILFRMSCIVIVLLPCLISSYRSVLARPVSGLVKSSQTALPIAGAIVKILQTGDSTQTDGAGKYVFADVPDGSYTFMVGLGNYRPKILTNVLVSPSCCLPGPSSWRGDVDQSGGFPALADLSKLISFLKSQPSHYVLPCNDQANVDAAPAGNSVPGLPDLSKLISYLKNQPGHWGLMPCP